MLLLTVRSAQKVLTFSKNLVKDDVRTKLAAQDMPKSLGKLATWSIGKGMEVLEKKFANGAPGALDCAHCR